MSLNSYDIGLKNEKIWKICTMDLGYCDAVYPKVFSHQGCESFFFKRTWFTDAKLAFAVSFKFFRDYLNWVTVQFSSSSPRILDVTEGWALPQWNVSPPFAPSATARQSAPRGYLRILRPSGKLGSLSRNFEFPRLTRQEIHQHQPNFFSWTKPN